MTESSLSQVTASSANNQWTGESLRFTFLFSSNPASPTELWKVIAGKEPESVLEKPSEGVKQAQGSFQKGRLTVRQSPLRIDFIYGPNNFNPATVSVSPFVEIGPLNEAFDFFVPKIEIMNRVSGDCVRVAVGSVALIKGTGVPDSNAVFQSFNPDIAFEADTSTDLFYQINRPLSSKTRPELMLNRLFKWQVAEFGLMAILPDNTVTTQTSASMCRLEMDLSTPPIANPPLKAEDRLQIINEMTDVIRSIYFPR